ncbi:MAG: hypothetical protein DCC67_20905 [Planctomycetota bacterium]|nr:MAG: hypothetical protein DCC67_20905 [Planctomycetota bacterium]
MTSAHWFGYVLVGVSAALLAWHWLDWRHWIAAPQSRSREFVRRQLQRRCVASGLIGVIGAAMTLADRIPPRPVAMTVYLCALLLGGCVILALAVVDWRTTSRRRDEEQLAMLAEELRKAAGDLAAANRLRPCDS